MVQCNTLKGLQAAKVSTHKGRSWKNDGLDAVLMRRSSSKKDSHDTLYVKEVTAVLRRQVEFWKCRGHFDPPAGRTRGLQLFLQIWLLSSLKQATKNRNKI